MMDIGYMDTESTILLYAWCTMFALTAWKMLHQLLFPDDYEKKQ